MKVSVSSPTKWWNQGKEGTIPTKSTTRLILHTGIVIFHWFLPNCWNTLWSTWNYGCVLCKPIMMMNRMQFPAWYKIMLHTHLWKWRWSHAQNSDVRLGERYITIPIPLYCCTSQAQKKQWTNDSFRASYSWHMDKGILSPSVPYSTDALSTVLKLKFIVCFPFFHFHI